MIFMFRVRNPHSTNKHLRILYACFGWFYISNILSLVQGEKIKTKYNLKRKANDCWWVSLCDATQQRKNLFRIPRAIPHGAHRTHRTMATFFAIETIEMPVCWCSLSLERNYKQDKKKPRVPFLDSSIEQPSVCV